MARFLAFSMALLLSGCLGPGHFFDRSDIREAGEKFRRSRANRRISAIQSVADAVKRSREGLAPPGAEDELEDEPLAPEEPGPWPLSPLRPFSRRAALGLPVVEDRGEDFWRLEPAVPHAEVLELFGTPDEALQGGAGRAAARLVYAPVVGGRGVNSKKWAGKMIFLVDAEGSVFGVAFAL